VLLHILVKLVNICHESLLMGVRILAINEGQGQGFIIKTFLVCVCRGGGGQSAIFV
jgi:hypothetical protein